MKQITFLDSDDAALCAAEKPNEISRFQSPAGPRYDGSEGPGCPICPL